MKLLGFMFIVSFTTPLYFRFNTAGISGIDAALLQESFILAVLITAFYRLMCWGGDNYDR